MNSCPECGEEVTDCANFCPNCGTSVDHGEQTGDELAVVDQIVDEEIDVVESWNNSVPAYMVDEYIIGLRLYLVGISKGTLRTLIVSATAGKWNDIDSENLNVTPVYKRIIDRSDEREDDIQAMVEIKEPSS